MAELQHLFLDAIGPFFRSSREERINWSKIPFADLPEDEAFWSRLEQDFARLLDGAAALGFNGVTLDDLAHLVPHRLHDEETNRRIEFLAGRFETLFAMIAGRGLEAWITSDVLVLSPRAESILGGDREAARQFYFEQVGDFFARFPSVCGLILRIGESDGVDVRDPLRSHLHLKTASQANRFLRQLLPRTDALDKKVVLRTWTVGAHRIGDMIWHRGRLSDCLEGLDSPNFILSLKPGESDFFRHLPLNRAFFRYEGLKIIEFQARPEYEGAGEFPSYLGFQLQRIRDELGGVQNLIGVSVWVQSGGWHRFARLSFLESSSFWAEINAKCVVDLFQRSLTPEQSLAELVGADCAAAALEFFQHADHVIRNLWYIPEFARQTLFFRRIRIPPLLHVYWDSIFFNSKLRKILRHFVADHEEALAQGQGTLQRFPRMLELADQLDWPREDIEFMRDSCEMIALAREYYFTEWEPEMEQRILAAKRAYKKKWPRSSRPRFRIKTELAPSGLGKRQLRWWSALVLRRQRGYRRILDHLFTLNLLGLLYRLFRHRSHSAMPKFLKESAMGVDSLFR